MMLRKLALVTTLAVGAPTIALAADPPTAAETVKVQAPKPAPAESTNYAQREQQDQKAAQFQGGDVLVIGISGGAILVLLFLLLILA